MDLILTALIMGFLGSGHCVAMCGSLSMALGFSIPKEKSFISYSILISIGRIFGYALIGLVVNLLTQSIITVTDGGILYLSILSSILMIGIGLHVANINSVVLKTELIGVWVSPIIEPIKKRLLPIDNSLKCLLYGLFWGFLPCGLVYTAISLAITAPNPIYGSLVMLSFGVGTLPTLVGLTAFNSKLNSILEHSYVRLILGVMIISMAFLQLLTTVNQLRAIS